jgi:hypothetical protein
MHTRTSALPLLSITHSRPWQRLVAACKRLAAAPAHERPDATTLRDLGIDPSEWDSIQAEGKGHAPPTRRRVRVAA